MEGWIKIHRKLLENPIYFSEPFTRCQAWIDMLLIANHKEGYFYKRGVKVSVKRGQIGYDSSTLGERWKWSRGKVLRFLKDLEKDNQIVQQKNNVTTLISIVKYETYQTNGTTNETTDGTADGTQIVQQTDTNKNDNNNKNEKNEKNIYAKSVKILIPENYKYQSDKFKNSFFAYIHWRSEQKLSIHRVTQESILRDLFTNCRDNENKAIDYLNRALKKGWKDISFKVDDIDQKFEIKKQYDD